MSPLSSSHLGLEGGRPSHMLAGFFRMFSHVLKTQCPRAADPSVALGARSSPESVSRVRDLPPLLPCRAPSPFSEANARLCHRKPEVALLTDIWDHCGPYTDLARTPDDGPSQKPPQEPRRSAGVLRGGQLQVSYWFYGRICLLFSILFRYRKTCILTESY